VGAAHARGRLLHLALAVDPWLDRRVLAHDAASGDGRAAPSGFGGLVHLALALFRLGHARL